MTSQLPYVPEVPNPYQLKFLSFNTHEALFGGGMASGKTSTILYGAFEHLQTPGFQALILTDRQESLFIPGGIASRAMSWTDAYQDGHFFWNNYRLSVLNGGSVTFATFEDPRGYVRFQSMNLQYVGVDNAHHGWLEDYHRYMLSRLRPIRPSDDMPLKLRIAAEPHEGWIKERFVKANYPGRPFVSTSIYDNYALDGDAYRDAMKSWSDEQFDRRVRGDWGE